MNCTVVVILLHNVFDAFAMQFVRIIFIENMSANVMQSTNLIGHTEILAQTQLVVCKLTKRFCGYGAGAQGVHTRCSTYNTEVGVGITRLPALGSSDIAMGSLSNYSLIPIPFQSIRSSRVWG